MRVVEKLKTHDPNANGPLYDKTAPRAREVLFRVLNTFTDKVRVRRVRGSVFACSFVRGRS